MDRTEVLSWQGRTLLQLGVALFLFTSFEGFVVPYFAVPNLGRSVHTLSGFTGTLFLAIGLMWPMLKLGTTASRIAFWFSGLFGLRDNRRLHCCGLMGSRRLDYADGGSGSPRQ